MTTIYLVRHAEAEGNLYRRIHGWYDSLITDNGFAQIQALARRFQDVPIEAVYSSDLYRTKTTARAVYVPKSLPLRTDPDLRELHMGEWEDQPWGGVGHFRHEALEQFNASDPAWQAPGGESLAMVGARMERAVKRIAKENPDRTVAIFSHGTAIRQVTANIQNVAPEDWKHLYHSDNTAVTCLTWDGSRLSVVFEGDNSHLDPSISTLAQQSWWRKDKLGLTADVNLWYRPLDPAAEEELYREARREAWNAAHPDGPEFDGDGFWRDALACLERDPRGVCCAMSGGELAGIVQLDTARFSEEGAGYIPFCYIVPKLRSHGLGIQLIGQAVSVFRPMGRDKLRLRCAPGNAPARAFYGKHGFIKIGEEQGSRVELDILEKYIGYKQ